MDSRICSIVVPEHAVGGQCLPERPACLIAEDHPAVAKAVCRVLALDCDVVGTVANGSAVLEAAQRLRPDVIVVDLNLPDVDGLEACRRITQVNPEVKVIVFSAMNDPDVRQRSFEVGASAFVSKLAGNGELLSTIKRLCVDRGFRARAHFTILPMNQSSASAFARCAGAPRRSRRKRPGLVAIAVAAGRAGHVESHGSLSPTTTGGGGKEQAATPALVKAFEAELLALNAILRRATGVASPVGFSVETWGHLAGYHVSEHAPGQPAAGKLPIAGGLTFGAFPIFEYQRNGKTVREDTGETALQQFLVNQIGSGLIDRGNVADWGSLDTDAFLKPMPQGEIAGLPRYGDGLVIARDPAALWTPLPQRGALDLVVKARQIVVQGFEESLAAYTAQLAVVRDPAYRAKRVSEAKEAAAAAKMPNPQAFIKQIEDSIGVEEASLVKELGPATGTGKSLADAKRALSEVTDWIAQLSPAELAAPACYAEKGTTLRARFRRSPRPAVSRSCDPTTDTSTTHCRGRRRRSSSSRASPDASTPPTSTTARPTRRRPPGAAPIARWSRRWTRTRFAPGCAEWRL